MAEEEPGHVPPFGTVDPTKPRSIFRECYDCPQMVVIPAGQFVMGRPASRQPGASADGAASDLPAEALGMAGDAPQRPVTISYPFAVGMFEVTFAEWEACVRGGGCHGYIPQHEPWGRGKQPVINVDFGHARAYVQWLSKMTGKCYRLLSEAEWEFAARAGTKTRFHWGDLPGVDLANCQGCLTNSKLKQPVAANLYPPNAFLIHNMSGNVSEWVDDCFSPGYGNAPRDGSAHIANTRCPKRVVRGGSWRDSPDAMEVWRRDSAPPGSSGPTLGFRVGRSFAPDEYPGGFLPNPPGTSDSKGAARSSPGRPPVSCGPHRL